uniref:Tubulin tyrosine ligase like 4 n=1 Tax=Sphenodon punctatus TaxID=8508 RepID=A0A8D0H960_SPHPU
MASAGPEPYSTGLKGGARIPSSRRLVPPLTERPHESKALDLAQQQVKPIWQLRRKQVKALQDQGPGHSGISPQHSCFSLCSPRPGDAALPSQTLSPPRPLPDLLGSRLLYRQSCFRHKPYQRLEAICLRPSTSRRGQPCFYNPATGSSMSSSATDPLLLPGVAGERSGAGGKASHLGSGKPTSNIYRPVLNNNSFLRPNSAKVPAQPPPEGKKLKSVPKPLAVSWMRSGGNGEDSPLEKRPGKSNGVASLEQTGATSLLSPGQNSVVLGPERHSWHYEAGESKEQSLTEQEIPLTEAVRKLTEGSFRAVHAHRIDNPCLRTLGFHSGLFSGSSRLKPHILAQLTPKDSAAAAPLSVETGSPRLSSKLSLSGTENANVCTKRISVHLLASNPGSSDCSPLSQTVNFLALSNRDQAAKPEPPQLAIVSDVAAQISSIQLGKSPKRGKTALRRDLEDVADLPLLDQGAVEDVEEELPDGLEDSCSQGEEGEEEDDESDASSTAGLSPNGSVALISRYSPSMKSLGNKFMHLTNYSVNKKNIDYRSNADETACQGHKWALKALWSYLTQKGVNSEAIWEKIKDIVVKTIVASEPYVNSLVKMYVRRPSCCHELFGFDVLLDENLKPWILEVNISPSLHSNSPLDVSIKGQMIRDLLNLAGFVLPNAEDVASAPGSASSSTTSLSSAVKEKVRPPPEQFTAEKMKRAYYLTQKVPDQDFYSTILDILTPEDVRVLVETEDEFSRRGQFERVFPSCLSMRYLRFFEQPRYFNILTAQWELKHYLNKSKGVELLRSWCYKGYHDGTVADTTHVWSLPRSHLFLKSDLHLNGFGKLESGRFSKTLQRDGEEPPKTPEPNLCTPSLPLSKCASGALKKSPAPRTLSHLSAS